MRQAKDECARLMAGAGAERGSGAAMSTISPAVNPQPLPPPAARPAPRRLDPARLAALRQVL
jgi:hypothetical protein